MARRKMFTASLAVTGMVALVLLTAKSSAAQGAPTPCAAWHDDFSGHQLDPGRWLIADGPAPGYRPNEHAGFYSPAGVSVGGGYLALRLTQTFGTVDTNPAGVISQGALVSSQTTCGYGTYEYRMRMSSTATRPSHPGNSTTGSVSAGFIYVNNSQTEIDVEFSGANPLTLYFVSWMNPDPSSDPTEDDQTFTEVKPFDSTLAFHTYTFVWKPGRITFFIDGQLRAVHTSDVPSVPAFLMMNHWGTNGEHWGGPATVGTAFTRYFYIDRVSYRPVTNTDHDEETCNDRDHDHGNRNHRGRDHHDGDGRDRDDRDRNAGDRADRDRDQRDQDDRDRDDRSGRNGRDGKSHQDEKRGGRRP